MQHFGGVVIIRTNCPFSDVKNQTVVAVKNRNILNNMVPVPDLRSNVCSFMKTWRAKGPKSDPWRTLEDDDLSGIETNSF